MRINIQLTYNPFLKEKKANLTINGQEQDKDYLNDNLQSWINQLFLGLKDEWEGCTSFDFEFTGLEVDCQDVREAVEQAKEQGFDIRFTENVVARSSSERLAELETLFAEMKEDPMFKDKIPKHDDFKALEENIFDVLVVATMSSGKSTFINAMLGCDLLPTRSKAMTAGISEILHNPDLPQGIFKASRKNIKGEYLDKDIILDVSQARTAKEAKELLKNWNLEINGKNIELDKKTATIHLEGRLIGIRIPNKLKLRLSDTPGPNNSKELNHREVTYSKIRDSQGNNPLIIYLLNGEQLDIDDSAYFLDKIKEEMKCKGKLSSDRFMFVMNKMDKYFIEDEDNISDVIKEEQDFLFEKYNIKNVSIYPIVSELAQLYRLDLLNKELLLEGRRDRLNTLIKSILRDDAYDLNKYMPLTSKQREHLEKIDDSAIKRSGVPAVEKVISDYIEKYNEPYRIMQMTKVIDEVLKETRAEVEIDIQLDKKEEELEELRNKLKIAEEKLGKSQEFEKKINELKEKEILLSEDVPILFKQSSTKIENLIIQYSRRLDGDVRLAFAKQELQKLGELLNNELYDLEANIEKANNQTQQKQLAELNSEYSTFVSNYFDDLFDGIQVDLIKNFKQKSISLQNYLNLNNTFRKTVVIGTRIIKRGFLEKLFSLDFSDHFENITESVEFTSNIGTKLAALNSEFLVYRETLLKQLRENAKTLTQSYCDQLNLQFKTATAKFNTDLAEKTKRDDLEQIIKEAKSKLARLANNETILNRNKLLIEV